MEPRFGFNFADVRLHTGHTAADSARDVGAKAYTVGNNVVFGRGHYQPSSSSGQRLLAHELTHIVQQRGAARSGLQRRALISSPGDRAEREADRVANQIIGGSLAEVSTRADPLAALQRAVVQTPQRVTVTERAGMQLQRETAPDEPEGNPPPTEPAPDPTPIPEDAEDDGGDGGPAPGPVTGSVTLTPSTLTRGDSLTAAFTFDTSGGAAYNITDWSYVAGSETIARATTDTTFQTEWAGTMALSGSLGVTYEATPSGGTATTDTIDTPVTVADRTGSTWTSAPTLDTPTTLTGKPSPPERFSDLGFHDEQLTPPRIRYLPITSGPNSGLGISDITGAGTYRGTPQIHPDVTTHSSAFFVFHLTAGRLYFVPTSGARILIPGSEFSDLDNSGPISEFEVPDWEAFYKLHDVVTVTVRSGSAAPVTAPESDWSLATNDRDLDGVQVTDAAARALLGIGAGPSWTFNVTPNGAWQGFDLLPSADIEANTRGHEYDWPVHSHRANFVAMLRAVDPARKIESVVATPSAPVNPVTVIDGWLQEILAPDHGIVDEAASRVAGAFVGTGDNMRDINQDSSNNPIASIWSIDADDELRPR